MTEYQGVVGRYLSESTPWWEPLPSAAEGAPNVIVVLLDDVGYAQFGCYGSDIATPTFDRLADEGLRYSSFHTTALCSPTRACLLTGRNHHTNGMARIVEFAAGYPGYNATIPKKNGFLSEVLLRNGYATFAVGKWHLTPATEMAMGASRERWPLGRGFERFYGFLGGETDQYHPDLVFDNHQVDPPKTPEEGYHLTEDMVDKATLFIKDLRAVAPAKPFFLYFTPGAAHAPHQAPKEYIDRYRGKFDHGWDAWRDEVFARQHASGLLPKGTQLSERPSWVPAWESLSDDQRRLYARMMEVYAGFLEHTDAQIGRLLDFVDGLGELDNTIVLVMSDNGASAEGGPMGSFNEMYFFNFEPESLEENLRRIDDLGTPRAHNHYPWGWAWAGNTPLKRWKRETHEGGVTDPLIFSWPAGLGRIGATRHQYVHAVDVFPTLLDLLGITAPDEINGVAQTPIEGVSFAPSLRDGAAPSAHVTQYYEMMGCRALYHDGWKAVAFHPLPAVSYGDGRNPFAPFDEDEWELYHIAEDFSETTDLAAKEPEKLQDMIDLWWQEAERFQVLPLNNTPGRHGDHRHRHDRYVYHPGIGSLTEILAPNLKNRAWHLVAELDLSDGGSPDGVVVSQGSGAGGWCVYIKGRRLHYVHNLLGASITDIGASVELPTTGRVNARVVFTPTAQFAGDVELFYDGVPVGQGHVARTTPISYGMTGFTVGHARGHEVTEAYSAPFAIDDAVLKQVVIDGIGEAYRNPPAEERAALAQQ
jgi:arylsulfatase A-like enzyme